MDLNNPEILLQQIILLKRNTISDSEKEELDRWCNESESHKKQFAEWERLIEMNDALMKMQQFDADFALSQLKQKMKKQSTKTIWLTRFQRIAAILVVPLLLAIAWLSYSKFGGVNDSMVVWQTVENTQGMRTSMLLPDSTRVWLNAGSSIKYPVQFSKNIRKVKVQGEAFFDVKHAADHPFVVGLKHLRVRVLGTRFNVQNYSDEDEIAVTLEQGSVELLTNGKSARAITRMKPNHHAIFNKKERKLSLTSQNIAKYISWIDGILYFEEDNMPLVVKKLQRRFNVNIKWNPKEWEDFSLNGSFKDESLTQVLDLLKYTDGLDYKVQLGKKRKNGTNEKTEVRIYKSIMPMR
ncbi:FecR family protein [Prolixibacteraceae bacterium JC049]|nr:FecR family protein [Prolixibacteraceae bacterium JC049]